MVEAVTNDARPQAGANQGSDGSDRGRKTDTDSSPQHLLPGLKEQVPGTKVQENDATKRENEMFSGGYSFAQAEQLDGNNQKPTDVKSGDTTGDASGNRVVKDGDTTTTYDKDGKLLKTSVTEVDSDGTETTKESDPQGQLRFLKTQTKDGTTTQSEFDEDGKLRNYTHESNGKLTTFSVNYDDSMRIETTDKTGKTEVSLMDKDGNIVKDRSEEKLKSDLEGEVKAAGDAGKFSGALAVVKLDPKGGEPEKVFEAVAGMENQESRTPNTLDTKFRFGSMGKMFTSVAMMQLAESKEFKDKHPKGLDTPLSDILKKEDFPNQDLASKVTLKDLMQHTAGMGDFFGPEFDKDPKKNKTIDDFLKAFPNGRGNLEEGKDPQVGKDHHYSNFGYMVLGKVIEKVSGQNYDDYVQKNILDKAGMTNTGFKPESDKVPNRATGYMNNGGFETKPADDTHPHKGSPAGGGYSTVGDMIKFTQALAKGDLLNSDNTKLFLSGNGHKVNDENTHVKYGPGRYDMDKDGLKSINHNGGAPGMNASFRYFPETGYMSIVLSNGDQPSAERMDDYIHDRMPGRKP